MCMFHPELYFYIMHPIEMILGMKGGNRLHSIAFDFNRSNFTLYAALENICSGVGPMKITGFKIRNNSS